MFVQLSCGFALISRALNSRIDSDSPVMPILASLSSTKLLPSHYYQQVTIRFKWQKLQIFTEFLSR
jgi:hypothetical protein